MDHKTSLGGYRRPSVRESLSRAGLLLAMFLVLGVITLTVRVVAIEIRDGLPGTVPGAPE